MLTERDIAARLFEQVTGKPAPAVDMDAWPVSKRWRFVVHEQDGSHPMYRVRKSSRTIHMWLHDGQRRVWESPARFVFMIAGKQSGKTSFGPLMLLRAMQDGGAGDYLAVSATFDLFKFKMLPEIKKLFVQELGIGKYRAGDKVLEIENQWTGGYAARASDPEDMWLRVALRSADSETGLQSATAKWAWLDEAGLYGPTVWKDVQGRLALHRGGVFGSTTPYTENYLKTDIYDPWQAGDDTYDVIQFESRMNPFFSDDEFERLRSTMQTHRFEMDYGGKFGSMPGIIYADFNDTLRDDGGHLVQRFVIPDEWPRVVGIDPGVINPGKVWFAHDPHNDVYYLYRAQKGGERRTSKEHAEHDVNFAEDNNERVITWAIGSKSEKYWREDYKAAGAKNVKEPPESDVEKGIDRVTQLIKEHRLYVFDDLVDVRREFTSYRRVYDRKTQRVTDKIENKSQFHLLDGVRYVAMQVVTGKKQTWNISTEQSNWTGRGKNSNDGMDWFPS